MDYPETKVYFDGSHYIAIPHTTRSSKKRKTHVEEEITVVQDEQNNTTLIETKDTTNDVKPTELAALSSETVAVVKAKEAQKTEHVVKKTTRKDLFEEFYEATKDMPSGMRRLELIANMIP